MRLNVDRTKYEKKTTINLVTSTRKKETKKRWKRGWRKKEGTTKRQNIEKNPISTVCLSGDQTIKYDIYIHLTYTHYVIC